MFTPPNVIGCCSPTKTDADKARLRQEVVSCWPFAPELLNLLEDNILMADAAQNNRDLIRILAEVFREREGNAPLVTPADFSIENDSCGVTSLLDSLAASADQEQLRQKALRNLQAIRDASITAPHAVGVVSALWIRSLSAAHDAGGTRQEVQLDVTGGTPVDDNSFTAELTEIVDNSFNIHDVGTTEKRYCFKLPENPVSKVKAWARNDRSFEPETAAPPGLLPVRKDQEYLRTVLNYLLKSPDSTSEQPCVPIVLDPNWEKAPWANMQSANRSSVEMGTTRRSRACGPADCAGRCSQDSWPLAGRSRASQSQHGPVPAAQGRPAEHLRRPRPDYHGPLCNARQGVGRL